MKPEKVYVFFNNNHAMLENAFGTKPELAISTCKI